MGREFKGMLSIAAAVLAGATSAVHAETLTLVENSEPTVTVVVPAAPGPSWFAAGELQFHIKKITGATLPIVKAGEPVAGQRIFVGMTEETRAVGLKYHALKSQEYVITNSADGLILIGQDPDADSNRAGEPFSPGQIPEFYSQVGTLYAVYDFLERSCGVRWYAPGDDGMVHPATNTFTVNLEYRRRVPALEYRQNPWSGQPGPWGMTGREVSNDEQKILMMRLKMGGRPFLIGHTFEGYPARFWEQEAEHPDEFVDQRPEYFSLRDDGTRNPQQMCFSSTALLERVIAEARDFFSTGKLTYRAGAGDGYYVIGPRDIQSTLCRCENCVPRYSTNWPHFSSGAASEVVWDFVNKVQQAINESHPGKHIACFNYFDYAYYPTTLVVDANVYCGQCLHTANWWAPAQEKNDMKLYQQWIDKLPRGNMICLWMYQCFPWETGQGQGFKVFPSWHAHTIDRQLKLFAKDGVRGIFVCGGVTPYIDGYLTIKLMDDPTLNVDEALDEFFTAYYGAADAPMKELYLDIEKTFMNPSNYPPSVRKGIIAPHQSSDMAWEWLGTPERMALYEELLNKAKALADSDKAKFHVAAYEKDIWLNHMVAGRKQHMAKRNFDRDPYPLRIFGTQISHGPGKFGNAYRFTNTTYLAVHEHGFSDAAGTFDAWIYRGDNDFGGGTLLDVMAPDEKSGHFVRVTSKLRYGNWTGNTTNLIMVTNDLAEGWHQITATWDATTRKSALYVDGALKGTADYKKTRCAKAIAIGLGGAGNYFVQDAYAFSWGLVDEIRLSSKARKPPPGGDKAPFKSDAATRFILHFDEEAAEVPIVTSPGSANAQPKRTN